MKRIIAGVISVLILSSGIPATTRGQTKPASQSKSSAADKIKRDVESLGRGSRVTVVLRNGNEYYGAIGEATEESFELLEIDLNQKITFVFLSNRLVMQPVCLLTELYIRIRTTASAGVQRGTSRE